MAFDSSKSGPSVEGGHPLSQLPREDQDLVLELVLRSGSLKELAESYGVSYPTIRTRLDRVIERVRALVKGRKPDPLSEMLAAFVERGEMSAGAARAIRDLARKAQRGGTP